jgi:hypothetical protein
VVIISESRAEHATMSNQHAAIYGPLSALQAVFI